jgi:hypothetical protein
MITIFVIVVVGWAYYVINKLVDPTYHESCYQ